MKNITKKVLAFINSQNVDFADIRLHLLDQQEYISTMNGVLEDYTFTEKQGYGIRVLMEGAWGFASSETLSEEGMMSCARQALDKARASVSMNSLKVKLAEKEVFQSVYESPCEIDPFQIPTQEKIDHFLKIDGKLVHEKFHIRSVSASFHKRHIYYIDSEGAEIDRHLMEVDGNLTILARDVDGLTQRRSSPLSQDHQGSSGWEVFLTDHFDQSERIRTELLEILDAPVLEKGECDLILLNNMMALQTHETIGHALELDRILGYELSYAGGSHINLDDFGTLQFGSEKLNARADGTLANSPGSIGFDDDGVKARNVLMIEKGLLKDAITSRQMIVEANELADKTIFSESGATCRAESYNRMPIERMNNINVDAGSDGTLEELIANVEDGVIMDSPRSWSIGSNRENFHFACEYGLRVKNGKITHAVRNPSYRGDSLKFWNSLKRVGDQSTWKLMPTFYCGKGQPNQIMRLGHGVPVCVFENVQVGE